MCDGMGSFGDLALLNSGTVLTLAQVARTPAMGTQKVRSVKANTVHHTLLKGIEVSNSSR